MNKMPMTVEEAEAILQAWVEGLRAVGGNPDREAPFALGYIVSALAVLEYERRKPT